MKLLLDQDAYLATIRFLRDGGHDVMLAAEVGCAQAADERLLQVAQEHGRVLVTRDRDFGGLVFLRKLGAGVIYLRLLPTTMTAIHDELARVLTDYSEAELLGAFVVVEPDKHRLRRIPEREDK